MLTLRRRSVDRRGWSREEPVFGRRILTFLLGFVLAGGLFVSVPAPDASADALSDAYAKQKALQQLIDASKAKLASLTASQTQLAGQLSSTKTTLGELNVNLAEVKSQLVQMTVQVAQSQAAVDELDATVAGLDRQIGDLEAEQAAKQEELDAKKAALAQRLRLAYDTDRTSLLEAILTSADFTDAITQVGYHMDLAEQDKLLAQQILADQRVLQVMHDTVVSTRSQADQMRSVATQQARALAAELAQLADARAQIAQLEARTKALLAQQQADYAQLAANKAALQAELANQLKQQQQLDALISQLLAQAGGIPSKYSGKMIWPVRGIITQEFGCTGFYLEPPYGNCAHFHKGIDIAAPMYTPIKAAAAGKVIFVGKSPYSSVWMVVIAHASNLSSWYLHIDNVTRPPVVKLNQFVSQGQVIAYIGMTGMTTGPHLHWAIQLNGAPVNPRLFL